MIAQHKYLLLKSRIDELGSLKILHVIGYNIH